MKRFGLGLVACVLMLAGCAGAGTVQGQPNCGHLTGDRNAAVFFVTPPGGTGACGYTYAGKPAGRVLTYPRCVEACLVPRPSPDGHYTLAGFTVTDTASGRAVAQLSDDALGYVWAPDSRHLCGVLGGGPPVPVVLVIAGLGGRPEQVTLAPLFTRVRYSNTSLLVCDPRHARAVLQASYQHVTAVAVVSLSDGAVLAEHDFPGTDSVFPAPGTPMVTGVTASADGRYLAVLHSIEPTYSPPGPGSSPATVTTPGQPVEVSPTGPPLPVPAYTDIFDLDHPGRPVARLTGTQTVAFSGDGALLAEQIPRADGDEVTRVVRWSDGKIIWQGNEALDGEATSPGVPGIAIETYQPGQPSNQIVLLRPDGQSIPVTDGQLTVP